VGGWLEPGVQGQPGVNLELNGAMIMVWLVCVIANFKTRVSFFFSNKTKNIYCLMELKNPQSRSSLKCGLIQVLNQCHPQKVVETEKSLHLLNTHLLNFFFYKNYFLALFITAFKKVPVQ
jgi:hypothetical protein